MPVDKSSFLRREMSLEDVIKQIYRPQIGSKVGQALDIFDRLVGDCETIVKLGQVLRTNGQVFHITPDDLRAHLDEFTELEQVATQGRAVLQSLGYVSRRTDSAMVNVPPVGKNVDLQRVELQLPGSAPLAGVVVKPKTDAT